MNEEIRKDMEIKEEELEQVSGGYWGMNTHPIALIAILK